ncbi:MAG: response regulator [Myxococcota bacterium]
MSEQYKIERKLTLMIVDDEEEILKMLARLFKREYNVVTANGGEDGLKKFDDARPELVLSDQRMRGMTGIEMLKVMKEREPGIVSLLITGFADIDVVIEALNHKLLHRYVTKPWDNDELIELVKEAQQIYLKNAGLYPTDRKIFF